MASVAPPSEETPANLTVPATVKRWTGPRAITPICCPSRKCCLLAVAASMSISSGCVGQPPLDRLSGLKRWFCGE